MEQKETTTQQENLKDCLNSDKIISTSTSASSWWGGWVTQAKEKSASVLEAVKSDLNELTSAVSETFQITPIEEYQEEATVISNVPQSNTVSYMKQSLSSFFGIVTDALIPQLDEEDVSEAVLITSDDNIVLSGFTKYLAQLQSNDDTYLSEPSQTEELAEKYRMWLEIVEQDQFTQQKVNKMLESSQILNEKYNKFVPEIVSHMEFFKRYLFKKALLEDKLADEKRKRREIVIEKQPAAVTVDEDLTEIEETKSVLKADVENIEIANFELSEEEQARLLNEYELEIKERVKSKIDVSDTLSEAKSAVKSSKSTFKPTSNVQSNYKNNRNAKFQKQPKLTQQQTTKEAEKSKKMSKELKMSQDHFKKESESSTSDESWEKEFDM